MYEEREPWFWRDKHGTTLVLRKSIPETLVVSIVSLILDPKIEDRERLYRLRTINRVLLSMLQGYFMTHNIFKETFIDSLKRFWRDRFPKLLFPVDTEVRERLAYLPEYLKEYLLRHWSEWSGHDSYIEGYKEYVEEVVQWLVFETVLAFLVRVGVL